MKIWASWIFAVLAILHASSAAAQTRTAPSPTPSSDPSPSEAERNVTQLDDIEVAGALSWRHTERFVRDIGARPANRLIPRWDRSLCVSVVGMDEMHAVYLKARIETVAGALGLAPDASGSCRPNITVYATNDPKDLASDLIDGAPGAFRPTGSRLGLGDAALDRFRRSDAPVRWWLVSMPLMVDTGLPGISSEENSRDPMARSVTVRNGSRLRGNVRDDLVGVTIILDLQQTSGIPFSAVSDYVAFVGLAPPDPAAETQGVETVLNLFHRPGVTGLSLLDEDYLFALYTASRAPASAALQSSEIAGRMATERRRRAAQADGSGLR